MGARQSFDEWASVEIHRPSRRPELTIVALADEEVVGYAGLDVFGHRGAHGLTAVRRDYRRRGLARAMKHALITAAVDAQLQRLVTANHEDNAAIRRLNEELGYRPERGLLLLRGPIAA